MVSVSRLKQGRKVGPQSTERNDIKFQRKSERWRLHSMGKPRGVLSSLGEIDLQRKWHNY